MWKSWLRIGSMAAALGIAAAGCGDDDNGPTGAGGSAPDTTAPAAVTDLAAVDSSASSVTLRWTAPGDDGASGTADSYDVRYSLSAISAANWASAMQAGGEPAPAAAGTQQSFTVTGLTDSTLYHFAMTVADDSANVSGLSNAATCRAVGEGTPDPVNVDGYWVARLVSDIVPDPEDRADVVRIVQSGSSLTLTSQCGFDGSMSGIIVGDSLYLEDDEDDFVMTATVRNDTVRGRWYDADYDEGEPDSGSWHAVDLGRQPNDRDCVAANADVICVLDTTGGRYIVVAQIDDHPGIVESAALSGDLVSGSHALSDTTFLEETDEWWSDPCDAGVVVATGGAPAFPLDYTIHIEFSDGASADVPVAVDRYYPIAGYELGCETYAGRNYFPHAAGDV